jgi:lysophospholipase L1-like esterase
MTKKGEPSPMHEFTKRQKAVLGHLSRAAFVLIFLCLAFSLTIGIAALRNKRITDTEEVSTAAGAGGDIDGMIFIGESTTSHLKSRGVLAGGNNTKQVWSNDQNTMTLDLNILQKTIRYPRTGQLMTIPEALRAERPPMVVLSFGVNGITAFAKNERLYRAAYGKLIDAVHEASPDTVVLLQTVYPVALNQSAFSEGAITVNGYIRRLNEMLPEIALSHDAQVVDTASVLRDGEGNLRADYQTGDGIHLTRQAYLAILACLHTHAKGI